MRRFFWCLFHSLMRALERIFLSVRNGLLELGILWLRFWYQPGSFRDGRVARLRASRR